jgi:hypothetical protein
MDLSRVKKIITDIHAFIQRQMWLDFEFIKYNKNRLTIVGSIDISIDHDIEICFDDVFYSVKV